MILLNPGGVPLDTRLFTWQETQLPRLTTRSSSELLLHPTMGIRREIFASCPDEATRQAPPSQQPLVPPPARRQPDMLPPPPQQPPRPQSGNAPQGEHRMPFNLPRIANTPLLEWSDSSRVKAPGHLLSELC